jgi:hypothetical protein
MVEVNLHSPMCLYDIVLNYLSTGPNLPFPGLQRVSVDNVTDVSEALRT